MRQFHPLHPRGRRGAAMLEATLLLPLFLIFWFGIVDWGLAFFVHETIVHQTNAAARWAVVHDYNITKIKAKLFYDNPNSTSTASPWWNLNKDITVDIQNLGTAAAKNQRLQITVSNYQWMHFTPFFADKYFGQPVRVSLPVEDLRDGI